jgi:hypothetical protein
LHGGSHQNDVAAGSVIPSRFQYQCL